MRNFFKFLLIALIYMFLSGTGCVKDSKQALFESDSSAVELRSYQSRVFDTTDKK